MSVKVMNAVFDRYPGGGGEFVLALALADNAHDDGTHIFPGVAYLAKKCRQSERSIQRLLKKLQDDGWLLPVKLSRGGPGTHSEYRISPKWLHGDKLSGLEEGADTDKLSPLKPAKRCQTEQLTVTNGAANGDKRSSAYITTRTIKEPNTPLPPKGGACGFESFFAEYPRQVDEASARRAWDKLAPDEQLQAEIVKAVRAWAKSPEWQREGGRFVPKPGNWLRKERWRDQVGMAAPSPQPAAPPPTLAPSLSPEQLEANKRRAREAVATIRASMRAKAVAA